MAALWPKHPLWNRFEKALFDNVSTSSCATPRSNHSGEKVREHEARRPQFVRASGDWAGYSQARSILERRKRESSLLLRRVRVRSHRRRWPGSAQLQRPFRASPDSTSPFPILPDLVRPSRSASWSTDTRGGGDLRQLHRRDWQNKHVCRSSRTPDWKCAEWRLPRPDPDIDPAPPEKGRACRRTRRKGCRDQAW